MIIIEASHVNFGGSLVLLEYLLKELNRLDILARVYISYPQIYQRIQSLNLENIEIVKTSTLLTIFRYFRRRSNVLFFCSLPPFVNSKKSILYFHSEFYSQSLFTNFSNKTIYTIYKSFVYYLWIKIFFRNVKYVYSQSFRIASQLKDRYNINSVVVPFFDEPKCIADSARVIDYDFLYPALYAKHKNHINLFKAVRLLIDNYSFKLALTIERDELSVEEAKIVDEIFKKSSDVLFFLGRQDSMQMRNLYNRSRVVIFPSLIESLGLPLIEASMFRLNILVSDLPYAYSIFSNPHVFNPLDPFSISDAMRKELLNMELYDPGLLIKNKVNVIIDELSRNI